MPEEQMPHSQPAEVPMPLTSSSGAAAPATLLDKIVAEGRMARDASQKPYAKDLIGEFVSQVLDEGMVVGSDTVTAVKRRISEIDGLISQQLNEIMHSPDFQAIEASWRGLHYLVMNTETGLHLKIRLLNVTKQDLRTDLEKVTEFDQSALFKRI